MSQLRSFSLVVSIKLESVVAIIGEIPKPTYNPAGLTVYFRHQLHFLLFLYVALLVDANLIYP